MVEPGSNEGETDDDSGVGYSVLVAEIPGAGRWSQANFSRKVFSEFFGAGTIDLTYIDTQGTQIHQNCGSHRKGKH